MDFEQVKGVGAASGAGRGQTAEVPLADALSLVDGHDVDDESENRWKNDQLLYKL